MPKAPTQLIYVSPSCPSKSLVFELNELLGLKKCVDHLIVCSIRNLSNSPHEKHSFASSLYRQVRYFRPLAAFLSGLRLLFSKPGHLLHVFADSLVEGVRDRKRLFKHLSAPLFALSFYSEIKQTNKSTWIHADFSQGSATTAWYLSRLCGFPFSMKAHAFDIYSDKPGIREREGFYRRKMLAAAKIFVVHNFGRDLLLKKYGEDFADKVLVNRVSIRLDEIHQITRPRTPAGEEKTFVAMGRLVAKKGFSDLIAAAAILKNSGESFFVDIWGSGPDQNALANQINVCGLADTVRLRGRYDQSQLPSLFVESRALVAPSVVTESGDMDGIPTVILEAMAYGLPVISTQVSGIPEVVSPGKTGLLVPPNDPEKLSGAMKQLLHDNELSSTMGMAAREFACLHADYNKQSQSLFEHCQLPKNFSDSG